MNQNDDELLTTFRKRVTRLREERGLSKQALARLAGFPTSTLTRIERADARHGGEQRLIGLQNLVRLARALRVQLDELVPLKFPDEGVNDGCDPG